ncbi:MAG: patatin-like phospholipase family protein [Thermoanaerobaculia bacterium]
MPITLRRALVAAAIALLASAAEAGTARPKIGLALGGGGARGCAHVGVLRALEELKIPVDYIAGTSIGAVVGGLYASGLTSAEIDRILTTTDWADIFEDRSSFKHLPYRRKEDEIRYLTAFEAGLKRGRLRLPTGLRSGQKFNFVLQSALIPVSAVDDFSKLPIPFKAVAADLETGERVVLDRGDLAQAIRASIGIPGVLSPIERDGRMLVDGGIADNVPVDLVRAMGADIVIAVDVSTPLLERKELGSMVAVLGQMSTILMRRNTVEQLSHADLVLTPEVAKVPSLAFGDAARIIVLGHDEAMRQQEPLARLAVDAETYADLEQARPKSDWRRRQITSMAIEGSGRVDGRIVRSLVRTQSAEELDIETLRRDILRVYALDDFEQVRFFLRDGPDSQQLVIALEDKPWGPTYVRFGFNLTDDLAGDSAFGLVTSVTRTRINALGGEWRTDLQLGEEYGVETEFYQPLDFRGRFFLAPGGEIVRNQISTFEGRRRTAVYDVERKAAWLDGGIAFGEWGAFRAGFARVRINAGVDAGAIDLPARAIDLGLFRAGLAIVRTDSPTMPTTGGILNVNYVRSEPELGSIDSYSKLMAEGYEVFSRGRTTLLVGAAAGTNLGTTLPQYDEFLLGGLLNLGGFRTGQLHGQRFALLRTGAYVRLRNLPAEIGGGLYAGTFVEAGNAWSAGAPTSVDDLHASVTLLLGAETILGPILFGYARADTSDGRFYVTIGKSF